MLLCSQKAYSSVRMVCFSTLCWPISDKQHSQWGSSSRGPPACDEWRSWLLSPWLPVRGPVVRNHFERLYSGPRDTYRTIILGFYNKLSQTACLQQQSISHGCGGWEVEIKVPVFLGPREILLPDWKEPAPHCTPLSRERRKEAGQLSWDSSYRSPTPLYEDLPPDLIPAQRLHLLTPPHRKERLLHIRFGRTRAFSPQHLVR